MRPARQSGGSFDRIARAYRWLEYLSFGRALERCRGLQVAAMGQTGQALVLGDGDGRFTADLLARQSGLRVVAVDDSGAMLALLSDRVRRVGASSRLVVVQGEAVSLLQAVNEKPGTVPDIKLGEPLPHRGWETPQHVVFSAAIQALHPAGGFVSVCSHFFLDCLSTEDVDSLVEGVLPRLAPGALWIVSEFAVPSWWTRLVVTLLYRGFAVLAGLRQQQLPEWREALSRRGLVCIDDRKLLGGLLTSTLWRQSD